MSRLTKPVDDSDHIQGTEDAAVTLVEYGDFQCPYCGAAYPVIKEIADTMGNRMRFVFREFPITEAHEFAEIAAEAAEAAGAQGKFWEMHDMIYEHQDELDVDHLFQWAQAIGINMERFDRDLRSHRFQGKVREDFMSGVHSDVNGTPTLFINENRYDGPVEFDALIQALEEAQTAHS